MSAIGQRGNHPHLAAALLIGRGGRRDGNRLLSFSHSRMAQVSNQSVQSCQKSMQPCVFRQRKKKGGSVVQYWTASSVAQITYTKQEQNCCPSWAERLSSQFVSALSLKKHPPGSLPRKAHSAGVSWRGGPPTGSSHSLVQASSLHLNHCAALQCIGMSQLRVAVPKPWPPDKPSILFFAQAQASRQGGTVSCGHKVMWPSPCPTQGPSVLNAV